MPARLSRIASVLRSYGVAVEKPSGSSHWKASRDGFVYTIPAHNGEKTEIADIYIRGCCRAFEIDFKEFKGKL